MKYRYVEIIDDESNEVIKRMDVSKKSDAQIEKIQLALSSKIDHSKYFQALCEYDKPQTSTTK